MKKILARREPSIPFTKLGYQKLLAEKSQLLSERPEAVDHLKKAREMGDLSENGYYKASRQRLTFLDSRIRRVERLIKLGVIVEPSGSDYIQIGTTVRVSDGKTDHEYTIVGGYESDPSKKTISHISPLGKALMGKRINDRVEVHAPRGAITYTITKIES
jgi:transcription elongation factor GreA